MRYINLHDHITLHYTCRKMTLLDVYCSPFKTRILPSFDASKVTVSGDGVRPRGVLASLPTSFVIDTREAGLADLDVVIQVGNGQRCTWSNFCSASCDFRNLSLIAHINSTWQSAARCRRLRCLNS